MTTATVDYAVTAPNEIFRYCHCKKCLEEMPPGTSPRDWARLSVGITAEGLQVWCVRHDVNVGHFRWASATQKAKNEKQWKEERR